MVRNMHFLFFGFVILFVVGACTSPRTPEMQEFKEHCTSHRHMWMYMTPVEDGEQVSDEACWGCMPDAQHHFCDEQAYELYAGEHDEIEGMMHGDELVAHGGDKESVGVGDYLVMFEREHFSSDMDGSLVFTISDEKGNAVTKLDIMHERPMHVVLVRDDLKYFDHIHPVLEGTSWVVNADFLAPGSYRLWVDFTKNMQQHLVDFDFFVDGESEPEPDSLDNLRVNIDAPEYIMVGQPVPLRFFVGGAIKDRAIPVKETFLGAAAHLVVIDSTLTEFLHDHDMTFDDDHILSFTPTFSSAGLYRAWVQFSVWGKDRTASFEFMVQGEEHHEET